MWGGIEGVFERDSDHLVKFFNTQPPATTYIKAYPYLKISYNCMESKKMGDYSCLLQSMTITLWGVMVEILIIYRPRSTDIPRNDLVIFFMGLSKVWSRKGEGDFVPEGSY